MKWTVMVAAAVLAGAETGCKKSSSRDALEVTGAGSFTQVLTDFQMQDILNGEKNMVVESIAGRLSEKERTVDVDKPRITFYKEGSVSSVLTAPKGLVGIDSHEVVTWGGVSVVTPDSTTLTTDRLRYDPKNQHLVSTNPVRLERPDSITVGEGMDAEPDLRRVRITQQKVYVKQRSK